MLSGEEIYPVIEAVNALPEVVAALEKRGVSEGDGLCLPRTVGRFFSDMADPVNDRLVRLDCLNIRGQSGLKILPTTSAFARPVEGLSILVDIEDARVIELSDSFAEAVHHPVTTTFLSFTKAHWQRESLCYRFKLLKLRV